VFSPDSATRANLITGTILSINISPGGVPKWPVARAELTFTGIRGDAHAHPRIHGGPAKAILLITAEGLDELRAVGYGVYPGALGENFTTAGLDRRNIRIGSRFRTGESIIEIASMRVPCATLDVYNERDLPPIQQALFDKQVKSGDASSPRWGLGGFYARVLIEGKVRAGDPISLTEIVV
jgi:MOSC domain-containing protein YiiM